MIYTFGTFGPSGKVQGLGGFGLLQGVRDRGIIGLSMDDDSFAYILHARMAFQEWVALRSWHFFVQIPGTTKKKARKYSTLCSY
jgi:hypothetical protein